MLEASLAVQRALVAVLTADMALMNRVTGVFDGVRPGATLPYVTVGPDLVSDAGTKTGQGCDHRLQLTVWDEGPGVAGAKEILALVEAALAAMPAVLDAHALVWVRAVRSTVTAEVEGATRGILEVRARTEAL